MGATTHNGYGTVRSNGRYHRAHRRAWELVCGKIPEGMFVLHKCDNRKCCNPFHLSLGTARDNTQDMMEKGRGVFRTGAGNGRTVLTADQARAIREDDRTYQAIASDYGVTTGAVGAIKRGNSWRHV